jgi:hypothetical protein
VGHRHHPYCLEESQTILLYKDKGDITDITKYRPVGLLNTYKLWTRHITTAMADYAETYQILSPNQKGFRQASTTMQQAQTIIMALEDARATKPKHAGCRLFQRLQHARPGQAPADHV